MNSYHLARAATNDVDCVTYQSYLSMLNIHATVLADSLSMSHGWLWLCASCQFLSSCLCGNSYMYLIGMVYKNLVAAGICYDTH